MEQWLPLTCSSTPVCLGAVLSAHSCPPVHYSHGGLSSLNFASACRSSREAPFLPTPFPSSSPSVLFAIRLPYRRVPTYPLASDVSPPPFIAVMFTPSLQPSSIHLFLEPRIVSYLCSVCCHPLAHKLPSFLLSHRMLSFSFFPIHIESSLFHLFVLVLCHLPSFHYRCFDSPQFHIVCLTIYASFPRKLVLIRLRVTISISFRSPLSHAFVLLCFSLRHFMYIFM